MNDFPYDSVLRVLGPDKAPRPKLYSHEDQWMPFYRRDFSTRQKVSRVEYQLGLFSKDKPEEKRYQCLFGSFVLHDTVESFYEVVRRKCAECPYAAVDIETGPDVGGDDNDGLDPYKGIIRTIQVTWDGRECHIFLVEGLGNDCRYPLIYLLENCPLVFHNGLFDISWLLMFTGRFPRRYCFDTLVAAQNLDAGLFEAKDRAFNLGSLSLRYQHIKMDKSAQKSFKNMGPLVTKQMIYAADDALATWRLAPILAEKIHRAHLTETFWELDLPCVAVAVDVKVRGVPVNIEYIKELKAKYDPPLRALEEELESLLSIDVTVLQNSDSDTVGLEQPWVWKDRLFDLEANHKKKIATNSKALLNAFRNLGYKDLKGTGVGELSGYFLGKPLRKLKSSQKEQIKKRCRAAGLLLEYRELSKGVGYILDSFLKKFYNPKTGCVHPNMHVCGSLSEDKAGSGAAIATGRWAVTDPSIQNQKADQIWRDIFCAPEGQMIGKADASQQEVRIMGEVSKDRNLQRIYIENSKGDIVLREGDAPDVYIESAAIILEIPSEKVTPDDRKRWKIVVLMTGFGASPPSIARSAGLPDEDGFKMMDMYFGKFPGIERLIISAAKEAEGKGYVRNTFSGRIRRWNRDKINAEGKTWLYKTQAANFYIQSAAADASKRALLLAYERLAPYGVRPMPPVHDELVAIFPIEFAERGVEILSQAMVDGSHYYMKDVPMQAEGALGKTWQKEAGWCMECKTHPGKPEDYIPLDPLNPTWYPRKHFEATYVRMREGKPVVLCGRCLSGLLEEGVDLIDPSRK